MKHMHHVQDLWHGADGYDDVAPEMFYTEDDEPLIDPETGY